jgi:hypothetical protein
VCTFVLFSRRSCGIAFISGLVISLVYTIDRESHLVDIHV